MGATSLFLLSLSVCTAFFTQTAVAAPHEAVVKRAVSRDGEPGLIGGGTYPRTAWLHDGSLLSCRTSFQSGTTILDVARSVNGGWDWTQVGSVTNAPTATRDLDNCFLHQIPSGRILAAFRNHDRQTTTGPYTYYRITVCYSDDNGATWHYLSQAAVSGTPNLGIWEPFMMDAQDGSLMLFYSRETNTNGSDQDSIMVRSSDGGAIWTSDQTITGGDRTARDGMLGVVRTGGSNLLAVFESLNPDTGITSVTSSDDGKTWGNRRTVFRSTVSGAFNSAPQVTLIGNKLVASFQTNEDTLSRTDVKVVTSTDGGASWGEKTTVLNACNWAGIVTQDSAHVLVACESGGSSLAQTMNVS
ncbi:hypothetical protein GQ53DRAFT_632773 [Thozetella sp. PMI_491]|nr:hypothetical protein GQ53DRAFT_632773 [Thozetella sp. PMI_491]